eukprot:TRINITY_DN122962_c0_g1_i1.p1 TRINITY_DN122962_c0_g1~~TRINITY_DN122962_c0_g1_i1.p1  ORF type:complete len:868 (+),score=179.62 TRINITY_DN122962_c0_g1_i1:137-2740(+)
MPGAGVPGSIGDVENSEGEPATAPHAALGRRSSPDRGTRLSTFTSISTDEQLLSRSFKPENEASEDSLRPPLGRPAAAAPSCPACCRGGSPSSLDAVWSPPGPMSTPVQMRTLEPPSRLPPLTRQDIREELATVMVDQIRQEFVELQRRLRRGVCEDLSNVLEKYPERSLSRSAAPGLLSEHANGSLRPSPRLLQKPSMENGSTESFASRGSDGTTSKELPQNIPREASEEVAPDLTRARGVKFEDCGAELSHHVEHSAASRSWHMMRKQATADTARILAIQSKRWTELRSNTAKSTTLFGSEETSSSESEDELGTGGRKAKPKCSRAIHRFERSTAFELFIAGAIFLNASYIGMLADYMARHELSMPPQWCDYIELAFLAVFFSEIALRFYVHGLRLFCRHHAHGAENTGFYWNVFDSLVVSLQIVEFAFRSARIDATLLGRISVLRMLRLLKIVRIVRVLKVLRFVSCLRMIVYSIIRSVPLFFWSLIALFILTFLWGVYLTEAVLGHKLNASFTRPEDHDLLDSQFGTLNRSMMTLLQSVTGGIDWGDVIKTLEFLDHWYLGVFPFLTYVLFSLIALMNVISGVFLETAMERAREERELYLAQGARVVFAAADHDQSGMITWPDFEKALKHNSMKDFFEAIGIDIAEARSLFDLLDMSGDGQISAEEFLTGCLRVRGAAKSLDLLVLSREVTQLFETYGAATLGGVDLDPEQATGRRASNNGHGHFDAIASLKEATKQHAAAMIPPTIQEGSPQSLGTGWMANRFSHLKNAATTGGLHVGQSSSDAEASGSVWNPKGLVKKISGILHHQETQSGPLLHLQETGHQSSSSAEAANKILPGTLDGPDSTPDGKAVPKKGESSACLA